MRALRTDGTLAPIPERGTPEERSIARSFNALSARLSAAYEGRMRFIAAAGHDLRTPMTRLRLRPSFLPKAERASWLRDLAELDAIADSAIRLVREETDPSSFERVALGKMIAAIVGELSDIGLHATATGRVEADVEAQPIALKRALRNLVENAARHGGGARVAVRREADAVLIAIEDDGPGIPAPFMDRVFEPFFSVDPARQKTTGGAGLGLAIAREIIERQGGRITLANRPQGGLRQEVRLPPPTMTGLPADDAVGHVDEAGRRRAHPAPLPRRSRRAGLRLRRPRPPAERRRRTRRCRPDHRSPRSSGPRRRGRPPV